MWSKVSKLNRVSEQPFFISGIPCAWMLWCSRMVEASLSSSVQATPTIPS